MKKLMVPIIGFFAIIFIYSIAHNQEKVKNKQEQLQMEQIKLQKENAEKLREQQLKIKQIKEALLKKLKILNKKIEEAYENRDINSLKKYKVSLENMQLDDNYNLIKNDVETSIKKVTQYINDVKEEIKEAKIEQEKKAQEEKKKRLLKELTILNKKIKNAYENRDINSLKKYKVSLENMQFDDNYNLIKNDVETSIKKVTQYINDVKEEIKEAKIEQEKKAQEEKKKRLLKELTILNKKIKNAYENRDINFLKKYKVSLENMQFDDNYNLIKNDVDISIKKVTQYINDVKEEIKEAKIERITKNRERKKRRLLKKLTMLNEKIEEAYENRDINSLKDYKHLLEKMQFDDNYNLIKSDIDTSLNNVIQDINNINYERKTFQENCVNSYNELEKEYQNAKGLFNDDESKIADVKAQALELKNRGCRVNGSIDKLIKKCDDDLN